MAQQTISLGTIANDHTGDTIRLGGQKINANFTELYTTKLDSVGAGTNVSIDNTDPINPIINVTALQSGDNISELTNDSNFITIGDVPSYTFEEGIVEDLGIIKLGGEITEYRTIDFD